jgi:hypothetical protein
MDASIAFIAKRIELKASCALAVRLAIANILCLTNMKAMKNSWKVKTARFWWMNSSLLLLGAMV